MKIYVFEIPHMCGTNTIYVLAESRDQAIKIVMRKTNNNYDFINNCINKIYNHPQIILNIDNTDY